MQKSLGGCNWIPKYMGVSSSIPFLSQFSCPKRLQIRLSFYPEKNRRQTHLDTTKLTDVISFAGFVRLCISKLQAALKVHIKVFMLFCFHQGIHKYSHSPTANSDPVVPVNHFHPLPKRQDAKRRCKTAAHPERTCPASRVVHHPPGMRF